VLTISDVAALSPATFSLDRSAFSVGRFQDDDSQVDYWLAQPAEQRLAALELLRESYNPDAYAAQRLRGFLRLLNEPNVRYLVIGGYAVAYPGYPRYTGGLDVFVEASQENAARLVEVYGEFGFNRSDLKPEMFMIPDNVVRIGHEPVRLEVLTSITGVAFTDAYVRRIQVDVNGLVVPFIALVDLLKNKTSTGRGKDRVDVEALRKRANP